jgi:hypothetical protein
MLSNFSEYETLGSPDYFYELFTLLENSEKKWNKDEIQDYFTNKIIKGEKYFDGTIPLCLEIKLLCFNDSNQIITKIDKGVLENIFILNKFILENVFNYFKTDIIFKDIFKKSNIKYNVESNLFLIQNSAFKLEFSQFKKLLISFGFLELTQFKSSIYYIINQEYVYLLDFITDPIAGKISPDKFKDILLKQEYIGNLGEEFVYNFELNRLEFMKEVIWISKYSVSEGFDIISFEDNNSAVKRFIEVKTYIGKPHFYWSKNEINISKFLSNQYYLYLIDFNKISIEGYTPTIINNPYQNIFTNESWFKEVENYKFTELSK